MYGATLFWLVRAIRTFFGLRGKRNPLFLSLSPVYKAYNTCPQDITDFVCSDADFRGSSECVYSRQRVGKLYRKGGELEPHHWLMLLTLKRQHGLFFLFSFFPWRLDLRARSPKDDSHVAIDYRRQPPISYCVCSSS